MTEVQDAAQGPMYTGLCGTEIKKMVKARSLAGIRSDSKVEVLVSRPSLYQVRPARMAPAGHGNR